MKKVKIAAKSRRRINFHTKKNINDLIGKNLVSLRTELNKVFIDVENFGEFNLHRYFRKLHPEAANRRPAVIFNPPEMYMGEIKYVDGYVDKSNDTLVVNVFTEKTTLIIVW